MKSPAITSDTFEKLAKWTFPWWCTGIFLIYKDECLFVCLYGTYTNSHFWTDLNQTLHTSPPWSGKDRRVCMDPKFLTFSTLLVLFLWRSLQNHGHKVAAGTTVFRDNLISVILAGVPLRSRKWRCSRRQSHLPQRHIPYSSECSRHVMDITFNRATGPSATVLYPLFQRVFASRHGYYVQPGDGAICHSVISLILVSVSVTYRKSRPCRRQLRVPTPSVRNAYDMLGREWDPCAYNSEPHQTGRKWLRNCNYTNNV
jgi:hypothetical protein